MTRYLVILSLLLLLLSGCDKKNKFLGNWVKSADDPNCIEIQDTEDGILLVFHINDHGQQRKQKISPTVKGDTLVIDGNSGVPTINMFIDADGNLNGDGIIFKRMESFKEAKP